jgi:hypothetical protein
MKSFLGCLSIGAVLGFIFVWGLDQPVVYVSNQTEKPVSCITVEEQELPISDSRCQQVLKGTYETVWIK